MWLSGINLTAVTNLSLSFYVALSEALVFGDVDRCILRLSADISYLIVRYFSLAYFLYLTCLDLLKFQVLLNVIFTPFWCYSVQERFHLVRYFTMELSFLSETFTALLKWIDIRIVKQIGMSFSPPPTTSTEKWELSWLILCQP